MDARKQKSLNEHVSLRTFANEPCNEKLREDWILLRWSTINVEVSQLVNPPELLDYQIIDEHPCSNGMS